MNKLLLFYLRYFPFDYGKGSIAKKVKLDTSKPFIYTNRKGITMELDLKEYQMRQIYLYDTYEKNTLRHIFKLLKKSYSTDITIADVGANIGFYSLSLAGFLSGKNVTIHSFEPNSFTHGIFLKNISLNKFRGIHPFKTGLSDKAEKIELSYNYKNLGSANIFSGKGEKNETIELIRFDDHCKQHNIKKVDLIKVDIEGAEMKFLNGAGDIFAQSEKMIVVMEIVDENCRKAGYTGNDLFTKMTRLGFKAYLPKPWPFSLKQVDSFPQHYHDNLIFTKGY